MARLIERLETRRAELGVVDRGERVKLERPLQLLIAEVRPTMTSTEPAAARYVGTRVHRVEDPRLLRGRGTFVDDVVRPGMAHAVFLRSPFARARIRRIDSSAALALPGVRAVFTGADLNPGVHEQWYTSMGKNVPDTPRPPMAEEEVRFVGDPVALVVAADSYVAEDAIELVDVDYEPLAPVVDYRAATKRRSAGARGSTPRTSRERSAVR